MSDQGEKPMMEADAENPAMDADNADAGADKADEETPLNDTVESKHRFIADSEVCCCCICNC